MSTQIRAYSQKVPRNLYADDLLLEEARRSMAVHVLGREDGQIDEVVWADDVPVRSRGPVLPDDVPYLEVCELEDADMVMLLCEEKQPPAAQANE